VAGGVGWEEESTEENEEGEGKSEEDSTQQVRLCCDERGCTSFYTDSLSTP
jgi:hypothetical protein